MQEIEFEWDSKNEQVNFKKHGISFLEAIEVFNDLDYLESYDVKNSLIEDRYIIIGKIEKGIIVFVYTIRKECIRVISARMATKEEERAYYESKSHSHSR